MIFSFACLRHAPVHAYRRFDKPPLHYDDAAADASRTSAVNFFHDRPLRLQRADIFFLPVVHLQQQGAKDVGALASRCCCCCGSRCAPASCSRGSRATEPSCWPWALTSGTRASNVRRVAGECRRLELRLAYRLLHARRSAGAAGKPAAARELAVCSHPPRACARVCATHRSREAREAARGLAKGLHGGKLCLNRAC